MIGSSDQALSVFAEEAPEKDRYLRHPLALFFHLLFRISALLTYLFCGWFSSSFVVSFIVILILLSMDFWTVKNISGRLLVGLRWWNHVDEEGNSKWIFESRKEDAKQNTATLESRLFWLALVSCQLIWCIFFFATLFTLKFAWLMVATVGVILNGANLYGYIRCKIGARQELSSAATSFLGTQLLKSAWWQRSTEADKAPTDTPDFPRQRAV